MPALFRRRLPSWEARRGQRGIFLFAEFAAALSSRLPALEREPGRPRFERGAECGAAARPIVLSVGLRCFSTDLSPFRCPFLPRVRKIGPRLALFFYTLFLKPPYGALGLVPSWLSSLRFKRPFQGKGILSRSSFELGLRPYSHLSKVLFRTPGLSAPFIFTSPFQDYGPRPKIRSGSSGLPSAITTVFPSVGLGL